MIAALLFLQVQATVPCDQDPRCRIERARAQELARYQAQYLRELERWVQAADDAADEDLPHRLQHPIGVDFFVGNSMPSWGVTGGYTPAWPIRVELFYGRGNPNREVQVNDPMTNSFGYTSTTSKLQTWGFQQRWYLLPGIVSPVATTGLGFTHGDFDSYTYCSNCQGSSHSSFFGVTAHSVYSGVGIDVQWRWIHALLAWRFQYTFYTSVLTDAQQHDRQAEKDLRDLLGESMEGVQFEIGARY